MTIYDATAVTYDDASYDYSGPATEFHRSHPKLLEMAAAIGVTEAQIEDLFIYGATLE